jgi:hypothetical protein
MPDTLKKSSYWRMRAAVFVALALGAEAEDADLGLVRR